MIDFMSQSGLKELGQVWAGLYCFLLFQIDAHQYTYTELVCRNSICQSGEIHISTQGGTSLVYRKAGEGRGRQGKEGEGREGQGTAVAGIIFGVVASISNTIYLFQVSVAQSTHFVATIDCEKVPKGVASRNLLILWLLSTVKKSLTGVGVFCNQTL